VSGEDWASRIAESRKVLGDKEGHTYEYSQVEYFLHPSGRTIRRLETLHCDADVERVEHDWLEPPEAGRAILTLRAKQAARMGKPAFVDLGAAGEVSPNPLVSALEALLQRSGGFVIAHEASGRFVQFAGGPGEPLLLDVPNLSSDEVARAVVAFAGRSYQIHEWEGRPCFNLAHGTDARAAAESGHRFFAEVLLIPQPSLTLETD